MVKKNENQHKKYIQYSLKVFYLQVHVYVILVNNDTGQY